MYKGTRYIVLLIAVTTLFLFPASICAGGLEGTTKKCRTALSKINDNYVKVLKIFYKERIKEIQQLQKEHIRRVTEQYSGPSAKMVKEYKDFKTNDPEITKQKRLLLAAEAVSIHDKMSREMNNFGQFELVMDDAVRLKFVANEKAQEQMIELLKNYCNPK